MIDPTIQKGMSLLKVKKTISATYFIRYNTLTWMWENICTYVWLSLPWKKISMDYTRLDDVLVNKWDMV